MDSKAAAPGVRAASAAPIRDATPPPATPTVAELLTLCERSRADGRHLEGAAEAEQVLATADITAAEQGRARELLSLHRLRLGEVEAAVQNGLLALEYLTRAGELLRQSQMHCTLALAFHETGLNEPALRHVLGALASSRASGSPLAEFWALSRSSMVHVGTGDSLRALELGRQALDLSRLLEDDEAQFAGLNNLGDTCLELARTQAALGLEATDALGEALDNVQQAAAFAHSQGHSFWETIARTNLGSILIELGRYAEAREQIGLSQSLATANGYRNLELDNGTQLAEITRFEGRVDEAILMMVDQLADSTVEEDPARLTRLHRGLVEMCKEIGEFERALAHAEKLHEPDAPPHPADGRAAVPDADQHSRDRTGPPRDRAVAARGAGVAHPCGKARPTGPHRPAHPAAEPARARPATARADAPRARPRAAALRGDGRPRPLQTGQ
ncbi:hypothetical protein [Cryobacterium breve]|uniref:hypothetical protein n=1 Tax=Cryobacterium breve TaxID=1259258 RepID=UPI00248CA863|nr:hypothetical protein [Cryobacterium breve]